MRIATGKKTSLGFGVALAILITIGAVAYRNLGQLMVNTAWVAHSHLVPQSLDAALSQITEAESGERGFVITGDERLLERCSAASGTIAGTVETLRHLTAGDPGQLARLSRLDPLIARKTAARQELIGVRKSAGLGAALKINATLEGKNLTDEIRQVIQEMTAREETPLRERTQRTETSARAVQWTILLGSLLACLVVPFSVPLINHDMAPRRKAELAVHESEEDLRRARDDLETHVQERTTQLATANENLKTLASALTQKNRQLQEFADVSSHDLQEPLRKIMAFGSRLRDKHGEALPADGRDCLARMLSSAQRMQKLIDDLLSFSRVATQAQPFARVDLTRVAEEAVSDLGARVAQTNGRVEIGNLPTIEADATQMRQLLQNLIGNALKFHRPETPPLVRVCARRIPEKKSSGEDRLTGPSSCQIVVEDNGIGFDEVYLDRIFKPFQRLHTRSEGYEGTGIGLAICRKIAERHNGRITARSTPGRGSTFVVTLLTSQAGHPNAGENGMELARRREPISILMADDDPDDCELTREALAESRLVNQMHFVKDGVELMDFLHHRQQFTDPCNSPRPGLTLLDLNMPRMDGREALREIKGDAGLRRIPVVVLTTSKAEIDIYQSYDLGANSFVTKPVTFEGLIEIMKTVGRYWFEIVELTSQQEGFDHAEISSQSVIG